MVRHNVSLAAPSPKLMRSIPAGFNRLLTHLGNPSNYGQSDCNSGCRVGRTHFDGPTPERRPIHGRGGPRHAAASTRVRIARSPRKAGRFRCWNTVIFRNPPNRRKIVSLAFAGRGTDVSSVQIFTGRVALMRPFFIPHLKNHESNGVHIVGGARPGLWRKGPPAEAALATPSID